MTRIAFAFYIDVEKPNGDDVGSVMDRLQLVARACTETAHTHMGALTRTQAPTISIRSEIGMTDSP